jgi:hypothetical protein
MSEAPDHRLLDDLLDSCERNNAILVNLLRGGVTRVTDSGSGVVCNRSWRNQKLNTSEIGPGPARRGRIVQPPLGGEGPGFLILR